MTDIRDATPDDLANYLEARKSIEKKRSRSTFLVHLTAFLLGNIFFIGWNALTYYVRGDDTLWFYMPLLFWGVGVIVHYIHGVALFDDWWENDETRILRELAGSEE